MSTKPRVLDLFCGAGGASYGYHLAGFEVLGVDIALQRRYPFDFIRADFRQPLENPFFFKNVDLIHASPPCEAYSQMRALAKDPPDYIKGLRELLEKTKKPYVIENVLGAPLRANLLLCGAMFPGLRTYRHRIFETNFEIPQPEHPKHVHPVCKTGRRPKENEWISLQGHFTGIDVGRQAMGINWMSVRELAEAIPPAYTRYIGTEWRKLDTMV